MSLNRLIDSGVPLPLPDVQSTTFSIDAMARFTCNTWDEVVGAQDPSQIDVVVIGSGMYGGYVAAKLFELGRRMADETLAPRVLVLESGPFLIGEHIQNVTRRSTALGSLVAEDLVDPAQTNEGSFVKHFRCVGGKSIFWGGWAPRYLPEDLERLDADGDRLWPEAIRDYLFQTDWPGGYAYSERETGVYPVQDFINGPLYDALKSRAEAVVGANQVPSLNAVLEPPIAVQGEGPGSGLFSFDKFSSVPLLLDSLREDSELAGPDNNKRRLFLVPYAEALKLETTNGRIRQVVVALADPAEPRNKSRARIVRLNLKSSAMVILAGNTINSTRLALNSFPRPALLNRNGELMGRNLMYHARSNFTWRIKRSALALPPPDPSRIKTAALHIAGSTPVGSGGVGRFHFQFYAAPNMDVPMFPGASRDPERFLYQMTPNIEDVESVLAAQSGLGNDRVVIGIRTVGETFGDRASPAGSDLNVSWMNVNPFGGTGDDVYDEDGSELRIPKAYVNLVKGGDDMDVLGGAGRGRVRVHRCTGRPGGGRHRRHRPATRRDHRSAGAGAAQQHSRQRLCDGKHGGRALLHRPFRRADPRDRRHLHARGLLRRLGRPAGPVHLSLPQRALRDRRAQHLRPAAGAAVPSRLQNRERHAGSHQGTVRHIAGGISRRRCRRHRHDLSRIRYAVDGH